jgi:hypothetical protein
MKLTRRDAIAALGAAGITSLAGCESLTGETEPPSEMETMVALAEVLYPSEVDPTEEFVQTFLFGRITDEEAYQTELEAGTETLNDAASDMEGDAFARLDTDQRVSVIENSDIRTGESVPDGSDIQRVNYHLVDELLFAFYSSPTGGELVGNTNPRGFPGGYGYSPPLEQ